MVHSSTENGQSSQPLLFTPLQIGNITVKNRICISPMCQYSCEDGFVNDWHLVHLGARAIGGAGIVMMEATAVEARGRISAHCPGIWKDEHIEPMKRICQFIKSQNCIPAIQLAHSGRKGSTRPPWVSRDSLPVDQGGWDDIIGPSPIGECNTKLAIYMFLTCSFYSFRRWKRPYSKRSNRRRHCFNSTCIC